jgi:hypothetical protein
MAEIQHGTLGSYSNRHCRCSQCRAAMRVYQAARRRRLAEKCELRGCEEPTWQGQRRCRAHTPEALVARLRDEAAASREFAEMLAALAAER